MKVCLMKDNSSSWNLTSEELIEKYFFFETNEKIDIGVPFKYQGKCYHAGCIRRIKKAPKDQIAMVRKFTEKSGETVNFEGEITCPYCKHTIGDSWELGDSEEKQICDVCGSVFSWEREVEVTYSSAPVEKFEIQEIQSVITV